MMQFFRENRSQATLVAMALGFAMAYIAFDSATCLLITLATCAVGLIDWYRIYIYKEGKNTDGK